MNRRKAALILASMIGVMTQKVKAQDALPSGVTSGKTPTILMGPMSVSFDLKGFKDYTFYFEGKSLTFTPEELFKILSE